MTNVAIFLPSLDGGGAERVMVTLANEFASSHGLSVDMVLANAHGSYLSEVLPSVRIVDLSCRRVGSSLIPLMRYLRNKRPAAMLSALNHANIVAIAARAISRVPTRLVVSERNSVTQGESKSTSVKEKAIVPLMRRLYPFADAVVAVSAGVAHDLRTTVGLSASSVRVIYNPVISPSLLERAAAEVKHPFFLEGVPVFLGIGRLAPQKDFHTLIRAFAKVRARRSCRLIILGDGELRKDLQELVEDLGVSDDVAMPGFVDNPFPWMRRAAAFVLSSRWEGLPNVLIQALACGTKVISTDCPSGPREILEDGRWGSLVQIGDAAALAHAMETALDQASSTLPPAVLNRFCVDQISRQYLSALQIAVRDEA